MHKRIKLLHIQKITGTCGSENHLLELLPRLDRSRYEVTFLGLVERGRPVYDYISRMAEAGTRYGDRIYRRHGCYG